MCQRMRRDARVYRRRKLAAPKTTDVYAKDGDQEGSDFYVVFTIMLCEVINFYFNSSVQRIMVKTTEKSSRSWSAIFSVIVYWGVPKSQKRTFSDWFDYSLVHL